MLDVHRLAVGDAVDYNAVDDVWLPARVESVMSNGCVLRIRFLAGGDSVEVQSIDLRRARDSWRIAPAGERAAMELCSASQAIPCTRMFYVHVSYPCVLAVVYPRRCTTLLSHAGTKSVPLLPQQPVDVLRRTPASTLLGASEQWLRGAWSSVARSITLRYCAWHPIRRMKHATTTFVALHTSNTQAK